MKKTLLLLLVCFCLTASASVVVQTATFNFAAPSSLSPSITPGSTSGSVIPLDNYTFTNGLITISFGRLTSNNLPSQIATYVNPYSHVTSYYLRINSGSVATFSGSGVVIKKIQFFADGDMGTYSPLKLAYDSDQGSVINGVWNPGSTPVTSVSFSSNAKPSYISKAIVTYEQTSILLVPTEVSLKNDTTVNSFQSMSLTFESAMTAQAAADNITLTGQYESGELVNEKPIITGNGTKTIVLSLENKIEKDGAFVMNIPAQSFRNAAGYENVALSYSFTVMEPRDTFNPLSIDPDTTDVLPELTFPITLQFPNTTESRLGTVDDTKTFYLSGMKEDSTWVTVSPLKAVKVREINGLVRILDKTGLNSYKDHLKYRVEMPEGVVFNQFEPEDANSRHNAAIDLIYTIGEPIPVDTLKEKKDSIFMLVSEVDSLLAHHAGKVGYPSNADGLNEVKNITVEETDDAASLLVKINKLLAALNAFYNDPEILYPEKDKWYTIASVNKDGDKLYLTYANGAVTLGEKASAYKVSDINDKVAVIETSDGKFLHVLIGSNDYDLTSTANVTSEKKYVNDLTLGKMTLAGDGVDQKPVAGLFTIKGGLGLDKTTSEKVGDAYALVVHGETPSIATSLDKPNLYFESDYTSAFRFAETVQPSDEVKPWAVIENPVLTSNTQVMTLEIKGKDNDEDVTKVAIKSLTGVKFTYQDGEETKDATTTADPILKAIEGTDNQFEVHVDGLADNTYTLVMPAGTFDFSENPNPVEDTELKVSFKIESAPGPGPDDYANYGTLPEMWGTIPSLIQGIPVIDTDLLEVYYYVTDVDVYPNKNAAYNKVTLRERWAGTFIAQGHFEAVYRDYQHMLKIVYDEGTTLADKLPLANGDYTLVVNRAAYGDENFNKRQNGDTTIAEEDCRVNQRVLYNNLSVDNSITGIKNFNGDEQLSDGKYVIDGKFIIVKGGKKFTATGVAF